jgi:hypothetical protein
VPHRAYAIDGFSQQPQLQWHFFISIMLSDFVLCHFLPYIAPCSTLSKGHALFDLLRNPPWWKKTFACSCPVEVLAKGCGAGWSASIDAWWRGLVLIFKVIRLPDTKGVDEKLECIHFRSIVQIRALIESRKVSPGMSCPCTVPVWLTAITPHSATMFLQAALCHCLRNCGQGQTYSIYTALCARRKPCKHGFLGFCNQCRA